MGSEGGREQSKPSADDTRDMGLSGAEEEEEQQRRSLFCLVDAFPRTYANVSRRMCAMAIFNTLRTYSIRTRYRQVPFFRKQT